MLHPTTQAQWLRVALVLLGVTSISRAEDAMVGALEPASVALPDSYSPPTRAAVKSILSASLTAKTGKRRPLRIVLCASEKDKDHNLPGMHDYPLWRERWSKLLALAPSVTVETADIWPTATQWRHADIVVVNSYNPAWALEPASSPRIARLGKDIDAFLARGGGLVFIHYALNAGPNAAALAARLGLAWAIPPAVPAEQNNWALNETHPLAAGIAALKLPDESYWSMVGDLDAAGAHVLLSSLEQGAPRPEMWTREIGKGRVFVSVPGHSIYVYDDPIYRILIFRGMMWSARQPMDRLASLVPVGARFATKAAAESASDNAIIGSHDNLVAWCVAPWDTQKRTAAERAQVLAELGFKHYAFISGREETDAALDAEIQALKQHGVNLLAWYFPNDADNRKAKRLLDIFKKNAVHPQL